MRRQTLQVQFKQQFYIVVNNRRISIVYNYIFYIIILTQVLKAFLFSIRNLVARKEIYKEATIKFTSANTTNYTINKRFLKDLRKQED